MLTRAEYYAPAYWGNPFSGTHRGVDITRGPSSGAIPMVRQGTVIRRSSNSQLGNFVVVQIGENDFDGYGHIVQGTDNNIGNVAGWDDDHGSAWNGPHIHFTNSSSAYGIDTPSIKNKNPLPILANAAYNIATSGGIVQDINKEIEDSKMFAGYLIDNNGPLWTFIWPVEGKIYQTRNQSDANMFGRITGRAMADKWSIEDNSVAIDLATRLHGKALTPIFV